MQGGEEQDQEEEFDDDASLTAYLRPQTDTRTPTGRIPRNYRMSTPRTTGRAGEGGGEGAGEGAEEEERASTYYAQHETQILQAMKALGEGQQKTASVLEDFSSFLKQKETAAASKREREKETDEIILTDIETTLRDDGHSVIDHKMRSLLGKNPNLDPEKWWQKGW